MLAIAHWQWIIQKDDEVFRIQHAASKRYLVADKVDEDG